jgi:hypothetical protein
VADFVFKSVMTRNWNGDAIVRHGRERASAAVGDANEDALEWLRANSVVVTGGWRDGWFTVGPSETPQGVSGGFGNSAEYHRWVNYGWSGFPGYHLAEQAWGMFYGNMGARLRGGD